MNNIRYQIGLVEANNRKSNPNEIFEAIYHKSKLFLKEDFVDLLFSKINRIYDFHEIHIQWKTFHENNTALLLYIETLQKPINLNPELISFTDEHLDSVVKLNQLLTNTITSANVFVNITEKKLKKRVCSDSFKEWDKKRRHFYDNQFSYRFLYELRNYAQHNDIPLSDIGFNVANASIKKLSILIMVNDHFINDYNWKKISRMKFQPSLK